ncbi:N-acetylglucosaminyl-phosphatidylinositol deacetylase, putative [Paecilomyces variotii No. 5]|uniref:N-acetylglucosaminylphosphatidylinositol deacetylase n=1 Tax=Byssochlamys spectabilis (strain No. 5 / NBRC 109023) TaxID=1356009 RepID=V5G246_BYSSN|nr:N-acetylglucosaminyl-phosphatidylinositol deacetylase, putative [Paecilomyces variotii No. 5]
MSISTLYALALTLPLVLIFWTLSSTSGSPFGSSFPRLYNKRICLLIAHPDDEAMFFAPTLLALTKPALGNHIKILCLSTGDADGLGHIRQKELQKSAMHLGLRSESDVFVVDNPARFPDSMTKTWAESDISSLLASAFAPNLSSTSSTPSANGSSSRRKQNTSDKDAPFATIDVLLTFDKHGVSNHPNHRSLYYGALAFLRSLMKGKTGYSCPVTLYTLSTTNILRKYAGVLDAPVTMFVGAMSNLRDVLGGSKIKKVKSSTGGSTAPGRLLFVSNVNQWLRAQGAMTKAHQSQMVWFRWGWITIGRYMVVNDLKKEKI